MKSILILTAAFASLAMAQQPAGPRPLPGIADLKSYLNLTDAQVTALQAIHRPPQAKAGEVEQQIRAKQASLDALLKSGSTDAAAIGRAVLEVRALRKKADSSPDSLRSQAANVLTAEQKTKLKALEDAAKLRPAIEQATALALIAPQGPAAGVFAPGGPGPRGRQFGPGGPAGFGPGMAGPMGRGMQGPGGPQAMMMGRPNGPGMQGPGFQNQMRGQAGQGRQGQGPRQQMRGPNRQGPQGPAAPAPQGQGQPQAMMQGPEGPGPEPFGAEPPMGGPAGPAPEEAANEQK